MNYSMRHIGWKDTCIFRISYRSSMQQQLRLWSIWSHGTHDLPFVFSSALCLLNNLNNKVTVNRGGSESGTQWRDTGVDNKWYGTKDDS